MKIFYSWQSDTDQKINRYFIQDALLKIAKNFEKENILNIEIDQATRDEPGSPDISDTIFKKIDECAIFVADISFINEDEAKKRTPNPNVLIELGYAIKKIGFEKIILIFNKQFGIVEKLPFDISHRRPLQYQYNNRLDKKTALDNLTTNLEKAILLIDRKTMTKEKVDFGFYDNEKGEQLGKKITISGILYQKLDKDDFLREVDFNELRAMKKDKLSDWQGYLYDIVKKKKEREMALASLPKGQDFIVEGIVINSFENEKYYEEYMRFSLLQRINIYRLDFCIVNNNDANMKNIKILLKVDKRTKIVRNVDFSQAPPRSNMSVAIPVLNNSSLYTKREQGSYKTFEYTKDNLYADEEFILDEPLYVPLYSHDLIKIEYSIFSENLPNIKGHLEIETKKECKILSPMDVFQKL